MWILFAVALAGAAYNMLEGGVARAAVASAVLALAWLGLAGEERLRLYVRLLPLWLELPKLRRELSLCTVAVRDARSYLRLFARRYPVYMRCPFRIDECGRVQIARSSAERGIPFTPHSAPAMHHDLGAILSEEGMHFPDVRILWLLLNREVLDMAKERIDEEVARDAGGDLKRVWRSFAQWERARTAEWGGLSLLYREALAEVLCGQYGLADERCAGHRTAWIDHEIEQARRQALLDRRKERLRADLSATTVNRASVSLDELSPDRDVTVDRLAELAADDMSGTVRILMDVFGVKEMDDRCGERSIQGYFLADHEGSSVVFQVGWTEQGAVPRAAVERALAGKTRERVQSAVLLALGRMEPEVVMLADDVGVLVLPSAALARMLDYHADRMWKTVEWSLRASRGAVVKASLQAVES